jgi:hypothetical protein
MSIMVNKEISQILEENEFLRRVETLRNKTESDLLLDKIALKKAVENSSNRISEKRLYLSAVYSVIFLWTLLFAAPTFALLTSAFCYPLLSAQNKSNGWRWLGYFIVGLSSLMQLASFF